jgi:hypothetical protein
VGALGKSGERQRNGGKNPKWSGVKKAEGMIFSGSKYSRNSNCRRYFDGTMEQLTSETTQDYLPVATRCFVTMFTF